MDSILFLFFKQDLQDFQDYFLFFLISRKEMRKSNPPAAEARPGACAKLIAVS
jgi:hypothetical protein